MQVSKVISAPLANVWQVLIDTCQWPVWGPSVKAVACSQQCISAGLKGKIQTAVGIWIDFEITSFEPLSYWHWKVAGVPATGHRLKELSDNSCELIFELPLVAFPYALICRQAVNRIAQLAQDSVIIQQSRNEP
ncbi:MAG: hypothetical protein OQL18_03840 [Deltaproteobacteria bacterium]|nr:hypothetical protein [Deltaproteobacteria bacterium]